MNKIKTMEIVLHDGTPVYLYDFRFYTTYRGLIVGNPTKKMNQGIIDRTSISFQERTKMTPHIINPKVFEIEQDAIEKKYFPSKESFERMPEFIMQAIIIHQKVMLMLPVIWLDDLDAEMNFNAIIERSGIQSLDFMKIAREWDL